MITKHKLVLDTTELADSDNVGAYIRSSDGTLITHTTFGGIEALDVNFVNDLTFADDSVDVSGSVVALDAPTLAALENITVSATDLDIRALNGIYDVGTNPTPDNVGIVAFERGQEPGIDGQTKQLTAANAFDYTSAGDIRALDVNAYMSAMDNTLSSIVGLTATDNNLDVHISNLADMGLYDEDSAHVSGDKGQFSLAVRNDAGGSLVSADGDYAPLQVDANGKLIVAAAVTTNTEYAEDSAHASGDMGNFILGVRQDADTSPVSADGDYHGLIFDNSGRLKVAADISVVNGFEKAEDAAHASGDIGGYMLSVRQDTLASSTSASGDYQSFKTDALGRLYSNDSNQSMENGAVSVTSTVTDLVASDLANRKRIIIQNRGNKSIFVGKDATVTTANGTEIPSGASVELDIGPQVNVHAIAASGSHDVRVLELA